ncbi:hypothetical protein D3C84_882170 [compost metagenome]
MDQSQVQVVGAQFAQALLQAWDQLVSGQVLGPDLAGQKQLIAGHATGSDRLANLGFVAVNLRRVDGPVTKRQSLADRVDHDLVFEAESTEAEQGNGHVKAPVKGC